MKENLTKILFFNFPCLSFSCKNEHAHGLRRTVTELWIENVLVWDMGSEVMSISLSVFRIHGPPTTAQRDRTDPKGPRPGQLSTHKLQSKLIDWLDVAEPRGLIAHAHVIGVSINQGHPFNETSTYPIQERHCSPACVHAVYVIVASIVVDNRRIWRAHMSFGSVIKSLQI